MYAVAWRTWMRNTFPSCENSATSRHKIGIIPCLKYRLTLGEHKVFASVTGPFSSRNYA
jgi:hypothetical protein